MNAITIHQPYAWAAAHGGKSPENRGTPISPRHIGHDLAIHAGRQFLPHGGHDPTVIAAAEAAHLRGDLLNPHLVLTGEGLVYGAVIAVVTVAGCHPATLTGGRPCCPPWGQLVHGQRRRPAFHITFTNCRPLANPVPCRGFQAVPWALSLDVAAQVATQLDGAR